MVAFLLSVLPITAITETASGIAESISELTAETS